MGRHVTFIDGLRALAVTAVLLYHLDPTIMRGGYVGVDIFFVISGFVITKSILFGWSRASFGVIKFYGSRMRRIAPAAVVVVAITCAISPFVYTWLEQTQFIAQKPWAAFVHLSNFAFADVQMHYGDIQGFRNPLTHTWSLGVENQFYLAYPLVAVLALRFARTHRVLQVAVAAVLIGSLAAWLVQPDFDRAFYLPQFRIWQIALGATVAMIDGKAIAARLPRGRAVRLCGQAVIASCFIGIGWFILTVELAAKTRGLAIIPTVATAIVLLVLARPDNPDGTVDTSPKPLSVRLLSMRPAVVVGVISYSLYLWHWPTIVILDAWDVDTSIQHAPLTVMSIILALLTVSWASYRFVEQPPRKLQRYPVILIVGLSVMGLGAFAASHLTVNNAHKVTYAADSPEYQKELDKSFYIASSIYGATTLQLLEDGNFADSPRLNTAKTEMLVIGNSHMEQFELLAARLATKHKTPSLFIGAGGQTFAESPRALPLVTYALERNPVRVVLIDFSFGPDSINFVKQLANHIDERYPEITILLIEDNPYSEFNPTTCKDFTTVGAWLADVTGSSACVPPRWSTSTRTRQQEVRRKLAQTRTDDQVIVIDNYYKTLTAMGGPIDPSSRKRRPSAASRTTNDYLLYDNSHFSSRGYTIVEPMIIAEIEKTGVFTHADR